MNGQAGDNFYHLPGFKKNDNKTMKYKKNAFSKVMTAIVVAGFLFQAISCSKDGERVTAPEVVKVTVTNISLEGASARYTASIDGKMIGDTLLSGERQTQLIEHKSEQRFLVKDANTGKTVIDTLLSLPEKSVILTILKLSSEEGASPSLYIGGQEDILPTEKLWSFYYVDPLLPDSLDLTMYRTRPDGGIDTLGKFAHIKKGKLFDFKKVDYSYGLSTAMFYFDLRDPLTGEILLGSAFDPTMGTGGLMAYNDFVATHFINDLVVYDLGGGSYFHYSTTILAY
ncbi:hypothetical protein SAMN04488121_10687 [Chitinophaga filiformis]|uniref:Uncharacterized protein n=2 Tax=Chitinophaga filiformis TaxID=104663 RepID=A0A1G7WQW3_CHIFI|nr:hypothetical protein SAMN04488121_10687 [Chitinophaga filiformis]